MQSSKRLNFAFLCPNSFQGLKTAMFYDFSSVEEVESSSEASIFGTSTNISRSVGHSSTRAIAVRTI